MFYNNPPQDMLSAFSRALHDTASVSHKILSVLLYHPGTPVSVQYRSQTWSKLHMPDRRLCVKQARAAARFPLLTEMSNIDQMREPYGTDTLFPGVYK